MGSLRRDFEEFVGFRFWSIHNGWIRPILGRVSCYIWISAAALLSICQHRQRVPVTDGNDVYRHVQDVRNTSLQFEHPKLK